MVDGECVLNGSHGCKLIETNNRGMGVNQIIITYTRLFYHLQRNLCNFATIEFSIDGTFIEIKCGGTSFDMKNVIQ